MPIGFSRYTPRLIAAGDIIILNVAYILVYNISFGTNILILKEHFGFHIFLTAAWLVISGFFKITDIPRIMGEEKLIARLIRAAILHSLIVFPVVFYSHYEYGNKKTFILSAIFFLALLLAWRFFYSMLIKYLRSRGFNYRRVVIVGGGHQVKELHDFFMTKSVYGYRLQTTFYLQPDNEQLPDGKIASGFEEIEKYCIENLTDEIYCSMSGANNEQVEALYHIADRNLIRFKLIPDFRGFFNKKVLVDFYETTPVLILRPEPLERISNRIIKRGFDIVFSLGVILLIFPILVPLFALLIKLSSHGPVFFSQLRTGKDGKPFTCLKFRTMRVNTMADELQASKNDSRITKIGAFLRKTSMDELPQFFNTLVGDMTIVGPRPHMIRHTEEYSKKIDRFMVRHFAKPGITGWAQVNGFRGETNEEGLMDKRVELDVWYVENYSPWLDIKIILQTVYVIVRGQDKAF